MQLDDFKNIQSWPLPVKGGVIIIAFILTLNLGYFFDISSLSAQLDSSIKREQDLKQQYQSIVRKKAELKQEIMQLPKLKKLLNEWKSSLIKQDDLADLMGDILKIGANNHLFFSMFDPAQPTKSGAYEVLPVKVVVVGSYHQIAEFISQIANIHQLVVVGDFIISSENKNDLLGAKLAEEANARNYLTTELKLMLYYFPDPSKEMDKVPSKEVSKHAK